MINPTAALRHIRHWFNARLILAACAGVVVTLGLLFCLNGPDPKS